MQTHLRTGKVRQRRISATFAINLLVVLLASHYANPLFANPPLWVEQAMLVGEAVPISDDVAGVFLDDASLDLGASRNSDDLVIESTDLADEPNSIAEADVLSPVETEALLKEIAAHWKAAEESPTSKYLGLIEDRSLAVEWLRSPRLVEPANPILVDPLDAVGLDSDPVYYVNGPWRTRAEAIKEASLVARQMQQPVWLIYNPTLVDTLAFNREDYLRVLSHLLFFGLPVPENLLEATLEGASLADIPGLGERSLADLAESQWDTRWYDWMNQAPAVEFAGRSEVVYPHQPNATTRQLASVLLKAERPLTVVTHSQGGLIFRNAALIASVLGDDDWSNRRVTWRSLVFPLAEKPRKAFLPGLIQVQMMYAPEDPLALALSGRGPFALWLKPTSPLLGWGFSGLPASIPLLNPALFINTLPPNTFPTPSNPPTIQNGRRLKITNVADPAQKIWVGIRYRAEGGNLVPLSHLPLSNWITYEIESGATADIGIVTSEFTYWVEGEYGRRDKDHVNTSVMTNTSPYYAMQPRSYTLSLGLPTRLQSFSDRLIQVDNNSSSDIVINLEATYTTIDGVQGKLTTGDVSIGANTVAGSVEFLRDYSSGGTGWPLRAATIKALKMEALSGLPKYKFPSSASGASVTSVPGVTNNSTIRTITSPDVKFGEMKVFKITIP